MAIRWFTLGGSLIAWSCAANRPTPPEIANESAVARGSGGDGATSAIELASSADFNRGWLEVGRGEGAGHAVTALPPQAVVLANSPEARAAYCRGRFSGHGAWAIAEQYELPDSRLLRYVIERRAEAWVYSIADSSGQSDDTGAALCAACHEQASAAPFFRPFLAAGPCP